MNKGAKTALASLVNTRSLGDARDLVAILERDHGFTWRPVGDREGNYGNINIGSDPGHAIVERVTNAIDGVIGLCGPACQPCGSCHGKCAGWGIRLDVAPRT